MFFNVYIKEAHPTDGWRMSSNDRAGIRFAQPKSFEERFGVAEQCNIRLDMSTPMLIDDIANSTCENYAAFPDRLYIIDLEGKVSYKGGRGPFGYKPREMEQALLLLMMEAQIKAPAKPEPPSPNKKTNEPSRKKAQKKPARKPTPKKNKPESKETGKNKQKKSAPKQTNK